MLVPPPPPAYTLSPALDDLDEDSIEVIERCLHGLTGQVGGVIVIGIGATDRHVIVDVATCDGSVLLMELLDNRPMPGIDDADGDIA